MLNPAPLLDEREYLTLSLFVEARRRAKNRDLPGQDRSTRFERINEEIQIALVMDAGLASQRPGEMALLITWNIPRRHFEATRKRLARVLAKTDWKGRYAPFFIPERAVHGKHEQEHVHLVVFGVSPDGLRDVEAFHAREKLPRRNAMKGVPTLGHPRASNVTPIYDPVGMLRYLTLQNLWPTDCHAQCRGTWTADDRTKREAAVLGKVRNEKRLGVEFFNPDDVFPFLPPDQRKPVVIGPEDMELARLMDEAEAGRRIDRADSPSTAQPAPLTNPPAESKEADQAIPGRDVAAPTVAAPVATPRLDCGPVNGGDVPAEHRQAFFGDFDLAEDNVGLFELAAEAAGVSDQQRLYDRSAASALRLSAAKSTPG